MTSVEKKRLIKLISITFDEAFKWASYRSDPVIWKKIKRREELVEKLLNKLLEESEK